MKWTKEPPTASGYYWGRSPGGFVGIELISVEDGVVEWYSERDGTYYKAPDYWEWWPGPIPEPPGD